MNLILDGLPDKVEVAGQSIPINTDFRIGILVEELLSDGSMSEEAQLLTLLDLYYSDVDFEEAVIPEALERICWFYRCGCEPIAKTGGSAEDEPKFSYEYDADYIYAAFLSAYKIDLSTTNLHWWQFRALFRALPDDTQFMKIVGYRAMKIPSDLPKKQKDHYNRMKRLYALPDTERTKFESDLTEILMNGGNPAALIEQKENSKKWQQMAT